MSQLIITLLMNKFWCSYQRSWAPAAKLGNSTSYMSRKYFLPLTIVSMATISTTFWAGFPFDNLCVDEESIDERYFGNHTITPGNDGRDLVLESIPVNATFYHYCPMNFLDHFANWPYVRDIQHLVSVTFPTFCFLFSINLKALLDFLMFWHSMIITLLFQIGICNRWPKKSWHTLGESCNDYHYFNWLVHFL